MNFLGPSLDKIPEGSSLTPADLAKMPNSRFELVFYYSSKLELSVTLLLSDFHVCRHHGGPHPTHARGRPIRIVSTQRTIQVSLYGVKDLVTKGRISQWCGSGDCCKFYSVACRLLGRH